MTMGGFLLPIVRNRPKTRDGRAFYRTTDRRALSFRLLQATIMLAIACLTLAAPVGREPLFGGGGLGPRYGPGGLAPLGPRLGPQDINSFGDALVAMAASNTTDEGTTLLGGCARTATQPTSSVNLA